MKHNNKFNSFEYESIDSYQNLNIEEILNTSTINYDYFLNLLKGPATKIIPKPDPSEHYNFYEQFYWVDVYNFFNEPFYIFREEETLMSLNESTAIFPELFLGFSIIIVILYGILLSSNNKKNYPLTHASLIYLSILILIFTTILTFNTVNLNSHSVFFNNTVVLDSLSSYSKQFILIISIFYFFILLQYIDKEKVNTFEYTILLLFSILGVLLICIANDLITVYLAIEVLSLSFYLLASFKTKTIFSTESGLKYFILGSFSSSLFLFGSSFIYGVTGSTNFDDFRDLYVNTYLDNLSELNLLQFGLIFILISLLFKLSLAPFHIWSPDIYEGSMTSSTFFFAIIPKLGIFIILLRFFYYSFFNFTDNYRYFLIGISLLSIIVGSFAGLEQRKIKSLMAYSSISHMGYSLLAFTAFTFQGVQALLGYLIIYMLSGLCLWAIILSLKLKNIYKKNNKDLSDITKLVKSNNILAISLAIVLLSIAGFPPLIGFYVKFNVFLSAIESTIYFASIAAILCSVISAFYYIRLIKVSYFEKSITGMLYQPIYYKNSLIISLCFFLFILLFINPNLLYLISYKMSFIGSFL